MEPILTFFMWVMAITYSALAIYWANRPDFSRSIPAICLALLFTVLAWVSFYAAVVG